MAVLKAPFNFVPMSEKVVLPEWASLISQDIPFSDAKCGTISVEVTAITPVYVRNGHKPVTKEQMPSYKETEEFRSFSKSPDGNYFIPATSIKGELRHVLEIASFGRLNRINKKEYKVYKEGNRDVKKKMVQFVHLAHNSLSGSDMAECIFGKVSKDISFKGRVQISHAFCIDAKETENMISPYMGSPKPTYYPIYLEQKERQIIPGELEKDDVFGFVNTYRTYRGYDSKLRGWKMYPARNYWTKEFPPVNEKQQDNVSPSIPLGKDSRFKFSIHFHNLTTIELGALLYALNPADSSCHSIGFAKSFGYGVCKYTVSYDGQLTNNQAEEAKREFVNYMNEKLQPEIDFVNSPQIKEMIMMMDPSLGTEDLLLEYMSLEEYKDVKEHNPSEDIYGQYLPAYSSLVEYSQEQKKRDIQDTDDTQEEAAATDVISQEPEGLLAKIKMFNGPIRKAELLDGKPKGSLPLLIPDENYQNGKDKIKILKKKGAGCLVRVKVSNDRNTLILLDIEK